MATERQSCTEQPNGLLSHDSVKYHLATANQHQRPYCTGQSIMSWMLLSIHQLGVDNMSLQY